ncbi:MULTISPECIES: polyprenyl synthetase family protein [Gordonia]|uniref:Geranylgeranyl pyrophosphate synthase n=3 Tax=Gordonia alkanivorans TaxID=84096 RepID=W9D9V8_9ACTN|nr:MULTISPECIES: polyprenyl synthetase family protein [Gordonia]ETA05152.1 geranylgeranyl pyrophosphate synthase [Gordonia alkanivorans CGMCC 6845]MDH3007945.1 polyprenyl synthetase family protein [Gordonia alkanivorans]MDH3012017.1 polyprenyl synthetase family protein [Gordonia alkanivorans]MDH3016694.1 polyprenyl synthetase family protein [Gordonia alkanivorans]MDH3022139.1 polyprenyl synthetase family protein [Gordonia alkanivorans]
MTSASPTPTSLDAVPAAVETELRSFFDVAVPAAAEIAPVVGTAAELVRDFVLQGGKRIRPVFAFAGWRCGMTESGRADSDAASSVGREARDALRVGAALELVQACALIHDDIIDQSDTRRGHPTLHRVFQSRHAAASWAGDAAGHGVAAAILAGDLALAWADDLVHDHRPGVSDTSRYRALPPAVGATWAAMRTEVLGGQFLDIVNEASGDDSAAAAYRVMEFKTAAYTVARPLELGARLAGASEILVATLRKIGHDLGIAFQLRDDQLGVFGDPERTGKPSGDDLVSGKRTALLATALRRADDSDPALGNRLRDFIGRPLDEDELGSARALLVDVGAVAEMEGQIDDLLGAALGALDTADIGDDIRSELTAVAHRTAHREA